MQNKATVFYKGGKETYTFPFPYLSKQFVKVRYDQGNTSTPLMYNKDYTVEGQTVKLTTAGSAQATICIYRQTPTGSLVDFNDGSILLASELDKMSVQLLHVAEENNDAIFLSGMFTDDGAWQAGGKRIKNVAAPSAPSDAVNLEYLDGVGVVRADELRRIEKNISGIAEAVERDRNITVNNAQGAAISEINAKQSENNAKTSETLVRGMQHAAAQYTDTTRQLSEEARDFRDAAESAADTAKQNALAANTSANSASTSAAAAAESAKKAAASAGLEGIVNTENIANEAVTTLKIHPEVFQTLHQTEILYRKTVTKSTTNLFSEITGGSTQPVALPTGEKAYKGKLRLINVFNPQGLPLYEIIQIMFVSKNDGYKTPYYLNIKIFDFYQNCFSSTPFILFDGITASRLVPQLRSTQNVNNTTYVDLTLQTTNDAHLIAALTGINIII